jgi:hypothetical protein
VCRIILWHVWCVDRKVDRFFPSKETAELFIKRHYGDIHFHPNEHDTHIWTRENYGGMMPVVDGHHLWVAWSHHHAVYLERHELEATATAMANALNHLPRHRKPTQ